MHALLQYSREMTTIANQQSSAHVPRKVGAATRIVEPQPWLPRVLRRVRVRHRESCEVLAQLSVHRSNRGDRVIVEADAARSCKAAKGAIAVEDGLAARVIGPRFRQADVKI